MALISNRRIYEGVPELGSSVDADTWLTPRGILSELGSFDLDPCACESNPRWVCETYFTVKEDGLRQEWFGRVFMNPPFSNTVPWLLRHAQHGRGVSLVPASIESRIWREVVWKRARGIFLQHGRTRFNNPDGSPTTGRPLRPVALIAWDDHEAGILRECSLAGVFLDSWKCS